MFACGDSGGTPTSDSDDPGTAGTTMGAAGTTMGAASEPTGPNAPTEGDPSSGSATQNTTSDVTTGGADSQATQTEPTLETTSSTGDTTMDVSASATADSGTDSTGAGDSESGGDLTCDTALVACDGECIDPQVAPDHCGALGTCEGAQAGAVCADTEACIAGVCETACPKGQLKCGGQCIDPMTDPDHCGAIDDCEGIHAGVVCQPSASLCPGAVDEVCQAGQCVSDCAAGAKDFVFLGETENFQLPACVTEITVTAWGAQGGSSSEGSLGGLGARVDGTICVPAGATLRIVVGEQPPSAHACGGGGGSFVAVGTTPLFVAGGGGGGYFNSGPGQPAWQLAMDGVGVGGKSYDYAGGGGGFTTNGQGKDGSHGRSFLNGALGGKEYPAGNPNTARGGFGGGGGASQETVFSSGGGGGFDGGDASFGNDAKGGKSYISPQAVNAVVNGGARIGHGLVELSW